MTGATPGHGRTDHRPYATRGDRNVPKPPPGVVHAADRPVLDTCECCGKETEPTSAFVASGFAHPSCRFGRASLTASATGELDQFAIDLWSARRQIAALSSRRRTPRRSR
jgi:hypothetical protein